MTRKHPDLSAAGPATDAVTVSLNPAIDRTVTIRGFKSGSVNRAETVTDAPGGKGVNVAVALADYGLRVAVTGFLGRENCAPFDALFAGKCIGDSFVRLGGPTRLGIKIFDPSSSETTEINFPGLSPSPADLELLRFRVTTLSAAWVVLAGSLPPGVDVGFYRGIITALKERGVLVALDTSGVALAAAIPAAPTLIKPNLNELAELVGRPLQTEREIVTTARRFVEGGVELVAISMGAAGAIFVTTDQAIAARTPSIRVASTVGAGDAMLAGLVAARLRGLPLADSARLATAFAVRALRRHSTGASQSPPAVETLAELVTVHAC